jgi:hypothetical protein
MNADIQQCGEAGSDEVTQGSSSLADGKVQVAFSEGAGVRDK